MDKIYFFESQNHKKKSIFLPGLNQRIKINLTRIIKSEEKSIFLPGLNQ